MRTLTDHETERLFFANALTPREYILDLGALVDVLPARALPRHHRARSAREVSLRKYIIRDVRHAFAALHLWLVQTDALRRGVRARAVHVLVMYPNGRRNVRYTNQGNVNDTVNSHIYDTTKKQVTHRTDDETERRRRAAPRAAREQLLDGVARLEARRGAFLPPGDGTPFRIDEALLEDVVEDVLEVEEVRGVADVDELRGHLFARAGRLVVRDPELGRSAVSGEADRAGGRGGHVGVGVE